MPPTIPLEEAQSRLRELIHELVPGQELVITENQQPVAKLVGQIPHNPRPAPGLGQGGILYMAADFNESMEDFFENPA